MPHTYVVASNTAVGDYATLVGTVDGIPVTVNYWVSAISGATLAQAKTFVAALMLTALPAPPPVTVSQLPVGTFTQ